MPRVAANKAVKAPAPSALNNIADQIGELVANLRHSFWDIGNLLNEAKSQFSSDAEFGKWRRKNVTDRYGISTRNQRNFMAIAAQWKRDKIPPKFGITGLLELTTLDSPAQVDAAVAAIDEMSDDKASIADVQKAVTAARKGANAERIVEELQADEQQAEAPQQPVRAPVVVDAEPVFDPEGWASVVVERLNKLDEEQRTAAVKALAKALDLTTKPKRAPRKAKA